MRIAVYGDSYAERRHGPESGAWWRVLESLGHDVTCFAESSSSFIWSAQLVDQHAGDFDFNIWCTTAIGRYSIQLMDGSWFHLSSGSFVENLGKVEKNPEKLQIISAFNGYIKYLYRTQDDDFIFSTLCRSLLDSHDNLMIVPGFRVSGLTEFHLSDVSAMEEDVFFANFQYTSKNFHDAYEDKRVCHMTPENNRILAKLINENLRPGVFSTDLRHFQQPSSIDLIFDKR